MRKQFTLTLAAAGIGIGAAAWAVGGTPVLAATPTSAPSASGLVGSMREHWPPATGWSNGTPPMLASDGPLATVLDGLVTDGTLTAAQSTAVQDAMTQQVQSHFGGGVGPFGGPHAGPMWSDAT